MKKLFCLSLVCLLGATIAFAAPKVGKVNIGTWDSASGDFRTNYWTEAFVGGAPGATGNVLTAQGAGFQLRNAALASVSCGDVVEGYRPCTTIYTGGTLFLSAGGPWLNTGNVRVDVTATNESRTYLTPGGQPTGELGFELTITGTFEVEGTPYKITAIAAWGPGTPEMRVPDTGVVIQRGTDFDCTVTISQP